MMDEPNLLLICLNAFVAVMGLLSLLAFIMRFLTILLPERKPASDVAVAAAIDMAVQQFMPGARVSHIESIR